MASRFCVTRAECDRYVFGLLGFPTGMLAPAIDPLSFPGRCVEIALRICGASEPTGNRAGLRRAVWEGLPAGSEAPQIRRAISTHRPGNDKGSIAGASIPVGN